MGHGTGRAALQENTLVSIGDHASQVTWKIRRRGLPWQRHTVIYMTVVFDCPLSERRIRLEFSGWCPQQGFDEILAAVRQLRCH
jgi:hypothetical protein